MKNKHIVGGDRICHVDNPKKTGTTVKLKFNNHFALTDVQVKWDDTGLTNWVKASNVQLIAR